MANDIDSFLRTLRSKISVISARTKYRNAPLVGNEAKGDGCPAKIVLLVRSVRGEAQCAASPSNRAERSPPGSGLMQADKDPRLTERVASTGMVRM